MTEQNEKALAKKYQKKLPVEGFENYKRRLREAPDSCFDEVNNAKIKSIALGVILSIFLGFLGIDRFYAQSKKIGFIKLGVAIVAAIIAIFVPVGGLAIGVVLYIYCLFDLVNVIKEVKICNYDIINEKLHDAIAKERKSAQNA